MKWEDVIATCLVIAVVVFIGICHARWWLADWAERNSYTILSARLLWPLKRPIFRVHVEDASGKARSGTVVLSYNILGKRQEKLVWDHSPDVPS